MATFTQTMSGRSNYYITLTVWEMSYDISRNSSIVHWKLEATKTQGTGFYSNDAKNPMHTKLDGTEDGWPVTYNFQGGSPKTLLFLEAEREIFHNADGTKTIAVEGYFRDAANDLGSATVTGSVALTNIPRYATSNQSLNKREETTIKMNWSSDSTCDYIWYSTNNGSSWTAVGSVNATSGNYTISGLSPNTTYNIKTRVRRKDSQLTTDSSNLQVTTYAYPSCSSAPNFTIGNNVILQLNNPLNRQVYLQMYSYVSGGFINSTRVSTTANGNYTFNASDYTSELYASIPNAKTSQYNIDVWYGNNKAVKAGGYYSINENSNKPTDFDFTYEDTNATTLALTGDSSILVQNHSNALITIPVANKATTPFENGATMARYNVNIGTNAPVPITYSSSEDVSGTVNGVTSGTITVYAEDSRGLTSSKTKTNATYKAYTDIARGNISITRQDNVGEAVTLTYNGTLWGDSFGDVTNTITEAKYRYKKTTESWPTPTVWNGTTTITPTISGNSFSFSGGIIGDVAGTGFDAANSYNIEVYISDKLSSTTFTITLGSGSPNIAIAKDGVAIKQKYDTTAGGALQVNGTASVTKNVAIPKDGTAGYGLTNSDGSSIIRDFNNQNVTVDATGKLLYLGYQNTTGINILDGKGSINSSGDLSINGKINIGSWTRNTSDTWLPIICNGELQYTLRKFATSKTHTDYNNNQDYLPTMSFISYWNGAYGSSNASNLTYAHQGTIQCKPTNLYNNTSGTNGNVTLSQTAANFTFLQVFYKTNDGSYGCQEIYAPNGKTITINVQRATSTGASDTYLKAKDMTISGTSMNNLYYVETRLYTSGVSNSGGNSIYIVRVDGWK